MRELPKCERCGLCCYMPCGLGKEDEEGVCEYLIPYADGTTACRYVLIWGKAVLKSMGNGCMLRSSQKFFEEYKKMTKEWKEMLTARAHIGYEESDDPTRPGELGYP